MANPGPPSVPALTRIFHMRAYLKSFLSGDYGRGFFRRVLAQAVAVIVLIEAIFLAERFTPLFRNAVQHDASLFDISLLLLSSSTEIFDLALAIAVLIASYAVLLQMRENRELLVLSGSGLGPYQVGALVLIVAAAAFSAATVGSGVIDPLSRYFQRATLFRAELHALRAGMSKGEFYYFPNYVAYALDRPAPGGQSVDRTLFVYQQVAPHTSRVVTAAKARLDGPDGAGRIVLSLGDFTSHTFADAHPLVESGAMPTATARPSVNAPCVGCFDDINDAPALTMRVRDLSQLMMVDQLLPFGTRGSEPSEQTVLEQLMLLGPGTPAARAEQMQLLAERLSRGLLTFIAPILALAAVSFTSRMTNWFALPLACVALMSVYLSSEWIITAMAPAGLVDAILPVLGLAVLVALAAFRIVVARQGALVRPQLARS